MKYIHGNFVFCGKHYYEDGKLKKGCAYVKLAEIKSILPSGEREDECIFYTYKDHCYSVALTAKELLAVVNEKLDRQKGFSDEDSFTESHGNYKRGRDLPSH